MFNGEQIPGPAASLPIQPVHHAPYPEVLCRLDLPHVLKKIACIGAEIHLVANPLYYRLLVCPTPAAAENILIQAEEWKLWNGIVQCACFLLLHPCIGEVICQ